MSILAQLSIMGYHYHVHLNGPFSLNQANRRTRFQCQSDPKEELTADVSPNGTVALECKVIGVPTPKLVWYKVRFFPHVN